MAEESPDSKDPPKQSWGNVLLIFLDSPISYSDPNLEGPFKSI